MWRLSASFISTSISSAFSITSRWLDMAVSAFIWNAPSRLAKQGIIMFSCTLRSPKISGVWNTREIPIWLIS